MRHRRRGRVRTRQIQHPVDAVASEHFQRAGTGRGRQGVGVDAHEQRPADALGPAVVTDGLGDRQHMPFVECAVQRRTPVPRRAERHALGRNSGVGCVGPIDRHQFAHINQCRARCYLTGKRADAAEPVLAVLALSGLAGRHFVRIGDRDGTRVRISAQKHVGAVGHSVTGREMSMKHDAARLATRLCVTAPSQFGIFRSKKGFCPRGIYIV